MTKKDYVLLTSILFRASEHMPKKRFDSLLDHACNLLAKNNLNFNEGLFRREVNMPMTFIRHTLKNE